MFEHEIVKTFYTIKEILIQNINIIEKLIEYHLKNSRQDRDLSNRHTIYCNLCKIENFLLFFLYSTLSDNKKSFKEEVEECLSVVYEYRIKYSRHFCLSNIN